MLFGRPLHSLLPRLSFFYLCVSALMMKRWKHRFCFAKPLAPPAKDSLRSSFASGGLSHLRCSIPRFALLAYFSRNVLNRVFDKDYPLQKLVLRCSLVRCFQGGLTHRFCGGKLWSMFWIWAQVKYLLLLSGEDDRLLHNKNRSTYTAWLDLQSV